jgi:hypothetical protein
MSIETASKRGLAIFLLLTAAILGAAVLDELSYNQQSAEFKKAIEDRFVEQSLKVGAWVMDRETVAGKIGVKVEDLPSHQMTQQRTGEQPQ